MHSWEGNMLFERSQTHGVHIHSGLLKSMREKIPRTHYLCAAIGLACRNVNAHFSRTFPEG